MEEEAKVIIFKSEAEMPTMAASLASTLYNKTGSWRYMRPLYVDKTPPCNEACPAGEDIVGYLALVKEGKYKEAIEHLEEVRKKVKVKNRRKLELGVFYNEIDILKTLAEVYEKNEQRALSHLIQKEIAAALAGS